MDPSPREDRIQEPPALRAALVGLLCLSPLGALLHSAGFGITLLLVAGCGLLLLKRIPQCEAGERHAIVAWADIERVLKLVLIVVGIGFAGIAAYATFVPKRYTTRRNANESAAIATLKNLCAAQAQCQASGVFDRDGDGVGEYAYFRDLASGQRLTPPVLSGAFAKLHKHPSLRGGAVKRSGYVFQIFLPASDGTGVPEGPDGGAGPFAPDPDRAEREWCCYAWPQSAEVTGRRAFFVNQAGDVLAARTRRYAGLQVAPGFDAAFARGAKASLDSSLAVHSIGRDGMTWKKVH